MISLLAKGIVIGRTDVTLLTHTQDVCKASTSLFGSAISSTRLGGKWLQFFRVDSEVDSKKFHWVLQAACLLHDIGKAIDHEVEGTHAIIGADFLKRYGVNEKVINCVAGHHHEVEQKYVEAYIVEAADAISGARPGARRESVEAYIKRVKTLEDIANSQQGVEQSYALQAGREIRILVRPEVIDDLAALELAKNVARQIEESMQYPGQIKVHVIRETRAIDYAK